MAARVQVIVEAKDATGGVFRAITSQLGAFGGLVEEITAKNVNWGNVAQMATTMVVDGLKDAINATTQYAREVRDLSLASGQSAEQASRMLQVLDDYQLTAEDAKTATRALTKEGLAPTVETIAKLSGEYLKLNSVEERNAFVQKNLGRAGQEWLNLLNQGPDAIMAMNDAVSENLILTDDNVKAAEDYRLALDAWNDSIQGLKISIGSGLLPVLTNLMNHIRAAGMAEEKLKEEGKSLSIWTKDYAIAFNEAMQEIQSNTQAMNENTTATGQNTVSKTELEAAEKAAAEAAKAMDAANRRLLGSVNSFAAPLEAYNSGLAAAKQELANGKLSTEEYSAKVQQLGADFRKASAEIVLSMVEANLARDGWTTAEMESYFKVGQKLGVMTQQQVDMGRAAVLTAEQITNSIDPITHAGARAEDSAESMANFAGAATDMGEAVSNDAVGPVHALGSGFKKLPPNNSAWDYFFNIHTRGGIPSFLTGGNSGSGGGTGACFLRGTLVTLSDGTRKPIERIDVGEEVRSYNTESGEFTTGIVSRTITRTVTEYLNIDGLLVTPEHPFWVIGRKEWIKAGDLQAGDVLLRDFGGIKIISYIIHIQIEADVFNLTVDGDHTYFAGGVLVHNKLSEELEKDALPMSNRDTARMDARQAMQGNGMSVTLYNYGPLSISADSQTGADIMSIR